MKITKIFFSLATAVLCVTAACQYDEYQAEVTASENLVFDYSKIEKNPQMQFYYSDEDEFYIDGITVYYNDKNITSDVKFTFYTTPETTYNGKDFDYIVPFIAEYEDKTAEGQLNVKIGMRGDVNCDHKVALNDLILIQNDLLQVCNTGKSSLTAQDKLGIFLGNADARQSQKAEIKAYDNNLFNIGDAFYLSSFLNGKGKSVYENIVLNNAIKLSEGDITIADCNGTSGQLVNVPVQFTSDASIGAFEITCKWEQSDLIPVGVVSANSETSVFSVIESDSIKIWGFGINDSLKNGNLFNLQFKIPETASKGTTYDITISNVDYFGAGADVNDFVLTYDGTINVVGKSTNPYQPDNLVTTDKVSYEYGIRAWDAVVEYNETEVDLPVMLLGGLETKGLTLKVQCDAPLSVKNLENAISTSGNSAEGLTGVYESDAPLNVSFETLKVNIDKGAKPGKYSVNITVNDVDKLPDNKAVTVFNGSVTIKEKSYLFGDANQDGKINVRDCAYIASMLADGNSNKIPTLADFNGDSNVNIRDAAAIAKSLVS